jgi:peptidoglycan hydrolase-like protein with peptidoglycan-binding domain
MFLGVLTLITALSISAVAIYYSVAGLVAIFAAAALPIMIMGGVLEVSKLVTAVWLHRYWSQATWWLKTYLSTAVLVLMLITSMGIFGFLSKAHIEQTAQSTDNLAKIETIQSEIARQQGIASRAETRIQTLENSTSDNSADVQAQIDKEQERIDNAYTRINPAIEEQNKIIAGVTSLFQSELDNIDADLDKLQGYIDSGEIAKAQGMIGAKADGKYGPKTAAAFTAYQERKKVERAEWVQKIQNSANSPTVVAARKEIARLRDKAEQQIADSNTLINRLRDQLGNSDNADEIQRAVDEQNERIRSASKEIDQLTEEKIALESEYRKLEAEVGPIKYIAEFIYGDTADNNMLEEAVRWVIITIIFVFDPLAVLLLIASQYTFEYRRKDDSGGWLRQYEQARAQRIVDNPGFTVDTPEETKEEKEQIDDGLDIQVPSADSVGAGNNGGNTSSGMAVARKDLEDVAQSYITANDPMGDMVPETDTAMANAMDNELESDEVQDDEVDTPEEEERRRVYDELDGHESTKELKQQWKAEHPEENLKTYKKLYIKGRIDNLPWLEEYEQNSEQDENSLWNKIQQNR